MEFPSETERYVVMPGQACSYKIGQLKILELRTRAKKELGEKFSLREFHNTVLSQELFRCRCWSQLLATGLLGRKKGSCL